MYLPQVFGFSNTPIGPFHTTVLADAAASAKSSTCLRSDITAPHDRGNLLLIICLCLYRSIDWIWKSLDCNCINRKLTSFPSLSFSASLYSNQSLSPQALSYQSPYPGCMECMYHSTTDDKVYLERLSILRWAFAKNFSTTKNCERTYRILYCPLQRSQFPSA